MSVTPEARQHATYLLVVLGAGVAILWVAPLFSSFWLDETITAWVVDDGIGDAIRRALDFQPMFPTYYVVAWAARALGGQREWVLRLPSVLAMAAAAVALVRLGTRIFDRETGLLAAIVFTISFHGVYAATDARPYALGLLALVVSTLLLVRWLDTGSRGAAAGCAIATALVVYVHYLFAAALVAHAVYAVRRRRDVGTTSLVVVGSAFVALLLPLVPWFLNTYDRRGTLSLASGSLQSVALLVAPPWIVAAIAAGAVFAGRTLRVQAVTEWRARRDEVVLLAIWAAGPPAILFLASRLLGAGVFSYRYILSSLPAISLLAGAAVRLLQPSRARRTLTAVFLSVSILLVGSIQHTSDGGTIEDWRGAVGAVNELVEDRRTPVVVSSGLIETLRVDLLRDPRWRPYLLAPNTPYPMDGDVVLAPYGLSLVERAYLEELTRRLLGAQRILVVVRGDRPALIAWFQGRLTPAGFGSSLVGRYGDVDVVMFGRQERV